MGKVYRVTPNQRMATVLSLGEIVLDILGLVVVVWMVVEDGGVIEKSEKWIFGVLIGALLVELVQLLMGFMLWEGVSSRDVETCRTWSSITVFLLVLILMVIVINSAVGISVNELPVLLLGSKKSSYGIFVLYIFLIGQSFRFFFRIFVLWVVQDLIREMQSDIDCISL